MLIVKNARHMEDMRHRSYLIPKPTAWGTPVKHLVCPLLFPYSSLVGIGMGGAEDKMGLRRWLMWLGNGLWN